MGHPIDVDRSSSACKLLKGSVEPRGIEPLTSRQPVLVGDFVDASGPNLSLRTEDCETGATCLRSERDRLWVGFTVRPSSLILDGTMRLSLCEKQAFATAKSSFGRGVCAALTVRGTKLGGHDHDQTGHSAFKYLLVVGGCNDLIRRGRAHVHSGRFPSRYIHVWGVHDRVC